MKVEIYAIVYILLVVANLPSNCIKGNKNELSRHIKETINEAKTLIAVVWEELEGKKELIANVNSLKADTIKKNMLTRNFAVETDDYNTSFSYPTCQLLI